MTDSAPTAATSAAVAPAAAPSRATPRQVVRLTAFRVVMLLVALLHLVVFAGWRALLAPWVVTTDDIDHGWVRTPELHRLADGAAGATFVAIAAAAVVLAVRPRHRSGLACWLAAAMGLTGGLSWLAALLQGHEDVLGTLVFSIVWVSIVAAVFGWLHPERRAIRRGGAPARRGPAPWLRVVLRGVAVVSVLAAVTAVAWRLGGGLFENPKEDDVFGLAYFGLLWALGASLAARARAGWKPLTVIVLAGVTYAAVAGASIALA